MEGGIIFALLALLAAFFVSSLGPSTQKDVIVAELRAGQYEQAHEALEEAIKQTPNDPALWTLNGFALSHLGQSREALASYDQALKLAPDYLPALEGAAQIEYQASDQRAVALLKKIVALNPRDETSHAMLGALAFRRGDCGTAVAEFRQSQSLITSNKSSLEEYGSCLVKLKQAGDAVAIFERLAELEPQNRRARYNLAVVELLAKRYRDAVATLTPVVAQNPHDSDSLDLLAEAYEALLDTPHAVAALRQAIVSSPDVPRYYLDFADICMAHQSYQVGIDMLNAGLKRLPNAAPLYLARGILYVQVGDFTNSQKDFAKAEELDPHLEYGHALPGLADLQQNRLPEAERDIRSRLRKAPQDAFLWYLLGETLTREGAAAGSAEFREALQAARRAVQLKPNFPLAHDLLGRLYLEEGKTQEAILQSRLAFQQDPEDQTALYHLILALRKGGNREEVAQLAKRLAALREQARAKEAAEHRYALVEVNQ